MADDKTINSVVFSDIPLNFEVHPVTQNLIPLKNERAIRQSVRNLVLMNFYETPYNGNLGSGTTALLFDNYTPLTKHMIKTNVEQVVTNYEPRAELIDVVVDDSIEHSIVITIIFRCKNSINPVTVDVFLERVR